MRKEREVWTWRHTDTEDTTTQGRPSEHGVLKKRAKECLGPLSRSRKRQGRRLLERLLREQGPMALWTPWFQPSHLWNYENTFQWFWATWFVETRYSSSRKRIVPWKSKLLCHQVPHPFLSIFLLYGVLWSQGGILTLWTVAHLWVGKTVSHEIKKNSKYQSLSWVIRMRTVW